MVRQAKIQHLERQKHKKRRQLMLYGQHQPKGAQPRTHNTQGRPGWQPMPFHIPGIADFLRSMSNKFIPSWMRRRQEDMFKD